MEIVLKNGEKIKLDWNPIILEYLEEYEGGLEQLKKDIESKECRFRTFNFMIYCLISSIYPKELGYREAISLVDVNDYDRIVVFIVQNVNNIKPIESTNINKENVVNLQDKQTSRKKHMR